MSTSIPSIQRADRGARLVRASVLAGFAAAVGLQFVGGEAAMQRPAQGSGCIGQANAPFVAL